MAKSVSQEPPLRWEMIHSIPAKKVNRAAVEKMPIRSAYYGGVAVEKGDDVELSFYACVRVSDKSWATAWSKQTLEGALEQIHPQILSGKGSSNLSKALRFLDELGPKVRKDMRYVEASLDDRPRTILHPLPATYVNMYKAGLLDRRRNKSCLVLDDVEWLSPEEIAALDWPRHVVPGLVPFAANGAGDHWCWYLPWKTKGEIPVVFSPHDLNTAIGYAPSFAGCVYAMILEQFARSTLLGERSPAALARVFKRYPKAVAPHLPKKWAGTLASLASRPIQQKGDGFSLLSGEEMKKILRRDLTFPHMGEEFRQHVS